MAEPITLLACPFCGCVTEVKYARKRTSIKCVGYNGCRALIVMPCLSAEAERLIRAGAPARGATDGKAVGCSAWLDALRWIKETAGESLEPYGAITDLDKQEETWHCHGCSGEFLSRWPQWTKPTDETFPHEAECMYLKASRLFASASNRVLSKPAVRINQLLNLWA